MKKMKGGYGKMPNEGKSMGGMMNKSMTNNGKSTGLRKEMSQRSDVMKKPSTDNRFPRGLS